ncbi:MAG: hypothetical protein ACK4GQ_00545 [Candidatus Hadarchaeales archaeon]
MEAFRKIDPRDVEEKRNHINEIVLWILRTRGPLSESQIAQEIFYLYGFSPSAEKVREALEDYLRIGAVERRKESLVSIYRITEQGELQLKKSHDVVQ